MLSSIQPFRLSRPLLQASRIPKLTLGGVSARVIDLPDASTSTPPLSYGVASARGPRDTMEDEAVVCPEGKCGFLYAMVLDGHDGPDSVEWLSDHMFNIFSDVLDESMFSGTCDLETEDIETGLCCPREFSPTLTESFHSADKKLLAELKLKGGETAMRSGSTATVALVKRSKIVVANVGDSRLVLCRKGQPVDLTTEHRVVGKGPSVTAEIERIKAAGGWIDDGRVCGLLAVSRCFGDWELKGDGLKTFVEHSVKDGFLSEEFASKINFISDPLVCTPDVTEIDLSPDDQFVIVATDGLWDCMSSGDAVRFVSKQLKKGMHVSKVAENLVDLAIKRYTNDNVAAIIIDLGNKN